MSLVNKTGLIFMLIGFWYMPNTKAVFPEDAAFILIGLILVLAGGVLFLFPDRRE